MHRVSFFRLLVLLEVAFATPALRGQEKVRDENYRDAVKGVRNRLSHEGRRADH